MTLRPQEADESHVQELRAVGLDDRAIHDMAQVCAYFNYINRVASGLGVPPEPDWATE